MTNTMSILFEWTKSLSVGDETIDEQHRQLLNQTNQVLEMMTGGDPHPERISHILDFLGEYIEKHFSHEEEYMRRHAYPELNEHCALHCELTDQYTKLREKINTRHPTLKSVVTLENFLGKWLINHIGEEDKKYHDFILKERTVPSS